MPLRPLASWLIALALVSIATSPAWSQSSVEIEVLAGSSAACGTWSPVIAPEASFDAHDFVSVFDAARRRVLVFGGRTRDGVLRRDVWQLDLEGGTWSMLNSTGAMPSARAEYAAILDPVRDRMLVFGGDDGNERNDLWALDLKNLAWSSLATSGLVPPPRRNHAAIYDPVRDRMVVIGGLGGFGVNADAYALSLATMTWATIPAPGPNPGVRGGHTAVYDPARDRVVVYGGVAPGSLFALDLATPAWSTLTPAGPPPLPLTEHSAVLDAARDRMIVFGGQGPLDVSQDTWTLEFSPTMRWVRLDPAGPLPAPRQNHSAILASDTMVILGSLGETADEIWRLSLEAPAAWTEWVPLGKPMRERESFSAIWDSQTAKMWVWGGRSGDPVWENDLWFLDPAAPIWTHVPTLGVTPAARAGHTAVFDANRQRMVLFGGRSSGNLYGDLWALDLSGAPAWSELGTGPGPAPRYGHTAVVDPVRDRMIVFGGTDFVSALNDVWALSLSTGAWTSLTPSGAPPPARYGHLAVYDSARDRVLVIGGTDGGARYNDAWALDLAGDAAWSALAPQGTAPPGIDGHAGAYDPIGDRVVFFGGNTASGKASSTWALSLAGTPSWQPVLPDLFLPQARAGHVAVWDDLANRLLISSGFSLVQRTNDVAAFSANGLVPLSVTAEPAIGGSTTRVPSRSCFLPSASVSITAVPASGYGFSGWSGDASGMQNPLVVPMTAARNIVASFTGHAVTTRANPVGTGLVHRAPDRATYVPGERVTLTASALDGGAFSHWSGDASGSTNPLTLEVHGPLEIVANFVGFPILTSVLPADGGLVERTPGTPVYPPGSQVELRAVGVGGRVFSHWSGDLAGNLNPITVTLDRPLNVVANFVGYPLTTDVQPAGSGEVSRTPATPYFAPGATVRLKALPSHDNDFHHWSGDAAGTSLAIDVVMDGPKTISAHFERGVYSLTTSVYPPGVGTVGRDPESQRYAPGRVVTLTANPLPGQYEFIGWTGDVTSQANPLAVTMTQNLSVTANFRGFQLTRNVAPANSGSITVMPDLPSYAPGTVVTVTAIPKPGFNFISWIGDLSGTENPTTITMDAPKTITAAFNTFPLELLVQPSGSGSVSTFPARPTYALGDTVTLTAVPVPGQYAFSHWSGALTGSQNPVTIVIDGLKTITANFTGYPLTVTIDPLHFGRVRLDPPHGIYAPGSVVTLTAVDSLAPFVQWHGDVTGIDNPATLVMDGPKSVTAFFYGFKVHVATDPPDPRFYVVRYPDQDGYLLGSGMILEAPTHLGLDFLNWTGDLTGTQNPVLFQITGEMYITAHFGGKAVNTRVEPADGGVIAKNPPKPLYAPGRTITLEAIPAPGLVFTGWTGDRTGPNPLIFTMPDDTMDVVAHFAPALPRCMAWRTVTTPNSPGPRTRHAVAFDYGRQRMILFGGLSGRFDRNNDVWVKPLSDDSSWVRLDAQGEPPEGRFASSAVHDPVRNRLIVFGGRAPSGVKNDVWAINLDGTHTWTQLQPTGALPVTRFGASAVYDPRGDRMIVFGGNATVSARNDTWALSLSGPPAWVQLNPQNPPPGRYYANTVYDPLRNRMIVIGGRGRFEESQMDDAWFLPLSPPPDVAPEVSGNFVNWSRLSPAGFAPDARDGAAAAFDPIRDRVVFAAGEGTYSLLNDVAELSMIGRSAWNRPQVPIESQPQPSVNGSMVFDAGRDRVLIYGGETANGTILADLVELSFANGLSLNVIVDPPGTGTFTISPTDPCVEPGTPMTFEAFAEPGYRFVTWENLATEQNPTTWTASQHMSVIARFAPMTTDVGTAETAFGIRRAFPNPTQGAVHIEYSLPAEAQVRLTVLDISGRVIANPVDGTRAAGVHSDSWDGRLAGRPAPEGIYFLRLTAGAHTAFRRVVLVR